MNIISRQKRKKTSPQCSPERWGSASSGRAVP